MIAVKTPRPKPWGVLWLPEALDKDGKSNEHFYQTHAQVRKVVQTKLNALIVWCNKFNKAGLTALDDVRREVSELQGHFDISGETERTIEAMFDEHSGMAVRLRIRRVTTT